MKLSWTRQAVGDLTEARQFIAMDDPAAALRVANRLVAAADSLLRNPELGDAPAQIQAAAPRGTFPLVVSSYLPSEIARQSASRPRRQRPRPMRDISSATSVSFHSCDDLRLEFEAVSRLDQSEKDVV